MDRLSRRGALFSFTVFLLLLLSACSRENGADLFDRGERLLGDGNYRAALEVYQTITDNYPKSSFAPASKYRIGMIYYLHMGNLKDALDSHLSLIFLYPESEEIALARKDMAEIYTRNGDHKKAIGEYQWLVEHGQGEERDTFRYSIALEYQKLSDFKQSIVELQDILKNSPSSPLLPKLYFQIATNHYLDGNNEEAVKTYDFLTERYAHDPLSLEARLGKAVILEEMGQLRDAATLLDSLLEVYPNRAAIEIRLKWVNKRIRERASKRR